MEKLLKEEKLIINCLKLYECLKWEQLLCLIHNKKEDTAQKILVGLKKRQLILEDESGYVKLDPRSEPDQKMISAFWILLQYIDKIDSQAHYPADYPSEIFFLKDNIQYEIITLNPNEENLVKMLFMEKRENSEDLVDMTKYIIVVPNEESIRDCLLRIPEKAIENKKILFATISFDYETNEANIQYFKI